MASTQRWRVRSSAPQADIDRVSRRIATQIPKRTTYEWVVLHQHNTKSWSQITRKEQLISECILLAKVPT